MKRCIVLVVILILGVAYGTAHAQQMKIGLVDFQRALNEVEEGKRAKASLKAEFEAKQKALNAQQEELKKLQESLETQRAALSAQAMQQKQAEMRDKFLKLQKTLADARQQMAQREAETTQNILNRLRTTVQKIGSQGGYTLIFEKSQDAVLYAPNATDLTSQVINSYNSGK